MGITKRLKEEDIEQIHQVFIETNGYVSKTARLTGFAKSTVSRYAKARNWQHEVNQVNKRTLLQEGDIKQNDEILAKLKSLRKALFDEITGGDGPYTKDESTLKIAPKTLSEAIKALVDIDKRISEREDMRSAAARSTDTYQEIITNCAQFLNNTKV